MQNEINSAAVLNAVKRAGDLFLSDYKQNSIPQNEADLLAQLDTVDQRCLEALQSDLKPLFPDTPWLIGDEFDRAGQQQPLDWPEYWLCDAMDGAIQYLQHLPGWSVNLVLVRAGRPYFSVIYVPLEKELFWAREGAGAFLNGAPLKPSTKTDPGVMVAVFNYGHQDKSDPTPDLNPKIGAAVTALLNRFGVVRNYGPHGVQLAWVGAGRIDLFYQPGLDTFNWLAGLLIAREAGAEVLTTDGHPWTWGDESLLVAAPGVATLLLAAESATKSL